MNGLFKGFDFSILDSPDFKEDSVREELIQPMLKNLGYSASGDFRIIRSKALIHPFVMIGSKSHAIKIIPDYLLEVKGEPAWVLDAKAPSEEIRNGKNVEQAYSYAIHPHVRVKFYALCNGKEFTLFHIESGKPLLKFSLAEIDKFWKDLYSRLSPQVFKENMNSLQHTNLSKIKPQLKSIPSKIWLPSVLVIGHRFDTDIQGDIQCVLWDEDEPNLTEYDIVIVDLTLERKPLLPPYRPRVWKDPEFNISDYLTWTHTHNRIEKLILSGGSIIVIVDSADVRHIDAPRRLMKDTSQKLLPFIIYGEQTPIGTSIKLVDPRFECYFRNFDGWNFTLNQAFDLEFEYSTDYRVRKVLPIALNKVNEMLAISVEVGSSKSEDSGWIHVLPKPIRKTSFDVVKSLVSNIDNFIQHLSA